MRAAAVLAHGACVKQAILIASSLALLSLVPAATADISILDGTVVIHTDGDPGVSILGSTVARVFVSCTSSPETYCGFDGETPAGLTYYGAGVMLRAPCGIWDACVLAYGGVYPVGVDGVVALQLDPAAVGACVFPIECVVVFTDPACISDNLVGEIVCET